MMPVNAARAQAVFAFPGLIRILRMNATTDLQDLAPAFSARLRLETRGEHESIERNRRLRRLSERDLSVDEYIVILVRMAAFLGPLEAALAQWADRFPASIEAPARLIKTSLLRRDIAALAPQLDNGAATNVVRLATLESAWGSLYVFEGATLGGQIMARSLYEQFGFTAERGAAFYNSYGKQISARWQAFKAALNAEVAEDRLEESQIIAAARATFQSMNAWMDADA
jgi:heme oxygenase